MDSWSRHVASVGMSKHHTVHTMPCVHQAKLVFQTVHVPDFEHL